MTLSWRIVDYKNDVYVVYKIYRKGEPKLFVTHISGLFEVLRHEPWHMSSGGYICHGVMIKGIRKNLYLHNLVTKKLTFDGKGQDSTVDHVDRIGTDNRKENLRFATQTEQNFNQNRMKRDATLPEDCGFTWDDVPKCVVHRFRKKKYHIMCVVIHGIDGEEDIRWESTSSKYVSLKFKLEHTKKFLRDLKENKPELFEIRNLDTNGVTNEIIELTKSYNKIIKKSGFKCYEQNKIAVPEKRDLLEEDLTGLTDEEIALLETIEIGTSNKRCKTTRIPEDSGVTLDMVPKYVSYVKARQTSGDGFMISGCPQLGKKYKWFTTTSSKYTTREKYEMMMEKYEELFDEEI